MNGSPIQTTEYPSTGRGGGSGCCCGTGCLTLFVLMLAGLGLVLGGLWYFYAKTVDALTSPAPIAVLIEPPSNEQVAAATDKLERLRTAAVTQQPLTTEFTAAELNALIAGHESFRDVRGKARVAIANSDMTVDLSVPLSDIPLPRVRKRWFNGSVRFALAYDEDQFALDIKSLSANGREIDLSFFQPMADDINRGFNEGFDKSQRQKPTANEFWENIRSMEVRGDKLIITTKGGGGTSTAVAR